MADSRSRSAASLLRDAVRVAEKLETAASEKRLRKPLQVAGYGFLVRNRRMAIAIARLGNKSAYEARIVLRSMLEIQINYAWIRLRNSHSRALRFHKFWSIERLRLLEKAGTMFRPSHFDARKRALEKERRKVRHLFRFRDRNNRMQWAQSWANVSSVEGRLVEVLRSETPEKKPDPFLYGMYVSFSSATHGSPNSLAEVLQVESVRMSPKPQPEPRPSVHLVGAFVLLVWTIEAFAEDARLRRAYRSDIKRVSTAFQGLLAKSKQKWRAA